MSYDPGGVWPRALVTHTFQLAFNQIHTKASAHRIVVNGIRVASPALAACVCRARELFMRCADSGRVGCCCCY